MEKNEQERIDQINQRIKNLKEHMVMWGKAGGVGGRMVTQAIAEIEELELEKEDLLNGTNNLMIYKTQKRLNQLKLLKEDANLIKKLQYNSEIKKAEAELQSLSTKSAKK